MGLWNELISPHNSSESDSDESFYGPIESPLEITNAPDDHEGGRMWLCDWQLALKNST